MAISVDTVYQRVLTLANKEQRGYITPQEFNLLANQAQMSIFESYFFSKNLRDRQEDDRTPEVDETDISELMGRKLGPFLSVEDLTASATTFPATVGVSGVQVDVFHTGRVFHNNMVCQKVSINEAQRVTRSKRHYAGLLGTGAIYSDNVVTNRDVLVYASSATYNSASGALITAPITSGVSVECFRVPIDVNWAYVVVGTNKKALYNANAAVDFELHRSEEDTVVNKILELSGIVMNKPGLMELAHQKSANELNLQKV